MIDWPAKEAAEVADYSVDFATKLAEGETVTGRTVTATGVTKDSDSLVGSVVRVWLSGGAEGTLAKVTITVTTDGGRTYTELALVPIGGGPIDLARAKAHLKVDWDEPANDALIASQLRAAVAAIEHRTDRALSPRVFTEWAPRFPWCAGERLTLARDPVTAIVGVTYVDSDGAEQTLDAADYRSIEGEPWSLLAPFAGSFPTTEERPDAVRVRYVAGYPAGECPPDLQAAVLLLTGHLYFNREAVNLGNLVTELPLGVQYLCEPFRRRGGFGG
jgi:uncharacterized phiE125 gp8 family phage protein